MYFLVGDADTKGPKLIIIIILSSDQASQSTAPSFPQSTFLFFPPLLGCGSWNHCTFFSRSIIFTLLSNRSKCLPTRPRYISSSTYFSFVSEQRARNVSQATEEHHARYGRQRAFLESFNGSQDQELPFLSNPEGCFHVLDKGTFTSGSFMGKVLSRVRRSFYYLHSHQSVLQRVHAPRFCVSRPPHSKQGRQLLIRSFIIFLSVFFFSFSTGFVALTD